MMYSNTDSNDASRAIFTEEELGILQTYRVARATEWQMHSPALLVVDVVESFVGPDVPVAEAQRTCVTACGANAWRAIEQIAPLLDAFRRRGAPVAFTTIGRLPPASDGSGRPPRAPTSLRHDVVVEPLAPVSGEFQFSKVRPSAFFGTPLMTWLTTRRVHQVVVVGGATSGCVRGTVVDAYSHGLDVLIAYDGCFDRVGTSHVTTLKDLDVKYGRLVSCAELVRRLAG